jgi:hypothetical protein
MRASSAKVFNARQRCLRLIERHGIEFRMYGSRLWVRYRYEPRGKWCHGWIALEQHLMAEFGHTKLAQGA